MGMSLSNGSRHDDDGDLYRPLAEINITPFVDVVLVLLIIFIITAPLMTAGVPVELPDTSAVRVSQPKKPMVVTLAVDGGLYIRDEQVQPEAFVSRLASLRAEEGDAVVYVRADKKNSYGSVMELLSRVREGGYQRVSLLSQPSAVGKRSASAED
jgi:biopolymer transport protein TolR